MERQIQSSTHSLEAAWLWALTAGAHTLTAVYGGDANLAASTSPAVRQTVAQAASTTAISATPPGLVRAPPI